jgi:4-diphosphocytidyl-2-C-methyl-D-erythritol kinase
MSLDFIGAHVRETAVFSPAKINLYLRIAGQRPDGYHELETVMLPLDFGDAMTFEPKPSGIELTCDDPRLPVDDSNLVVRAAKQLMERASVGRGAKIRLEKRTPLAAGLGGGSSNAATTLTALSRLWSLDAPHSTLHDIAAKLGSDINFFLAGGAAICRGRGELVEPIECRLSAAILLVNPGFGISTKWAYESWAAQPLTAKPPEVTLLARALAEDDLGGVCRSLYNSLEAPSVGKFPVLQLLKEAMASAGAAGTLMSGSGATVFGLFADAKVARNCAAQLRQEFGPSVWTTVTRFQQVAR